MKYDLAIIGFGVIGVESLHKITEKINKSKQFNIAVIEKDLKNIPGGVAYSKLNSKFGFFNNPLRLSHPSFKSWINNKENIYKIINFINKNPSFRLKNWLSINNKNLLKIRFLEKFTFQDLFILSILKTKF